MKSSITLLLPALLTLGAGCILETEPHQPEQQRTKTFDVPCEQTKAGCAENAFSLPKKTPPACLETKAGCRERAPEQNGRGEEHPLFDTEYDDWCAQDVLEPGNDAAKKAHPITSWTKGKTQEDATISSILCDEDDVDWFLLPNSMKNILIQYDTTNAVDLSLALYTQSNGKSQDELVLLSSCTHKEHQSPAGGMNATTQCDIPEDVGPVYLEISSKNEGDRGSYELFLRHEKHPPKDCDPYDDSDVPSRAAQLPPTTPEYFAHLCSAHDVDWFRMEWRHTYGFSVERTYQASDQPEAWNVSFYLQEGDDLIPLLAPEYIHSATPPHTLSHLEAGKPITMNLTDQQVHEVSRLLPAIMSQHGDPTYQGRRDLVFKITGPGDAQPHGVSAPFRFSTVDWDSYEPNDSVDEAFDIYSAPTSARETGVLNAKTYAFGELDWTLIKMDGFSKVTLTMSSQDYPVRLKIVAKDEEGNIVWWPVEFPNAQEENWLSAPGETNPDAKHYMWNGQEPLTIVRPENASYTDLYMVTESMRPGNYSLSTFLSY